MSDTLPQPLTCVLSSSVGAAAVREQATNRCLDEHDVAAGRRVVHAGRDADFVLLGRMLRVHPRPTEELAHLVGVDPPVFDQLRIARGHSARNLARDRADLTLELTHARSRACTC